MMYRAILLLTCDACRTALARASVCEQNDLMLTLEVAAKRLSGEIELEFDLLRRQAERSGWQCIDPGMLCHECAVDEPRFVQMIEVLKEGRPQEP